MREFLYIPRNYDDNNRDMLQATHRGESAKSDGGNDNYQKPPEAVAKNGPGVVRSQGCTNSILRTTDRMETPATLGHQIA